MMAFDWEELIGRLAAESDGVHDIIPPIDRERIAAAEASAGPIPQLLLDMLRYCNGAELFIDAMPFITLFGISSESSVATNGWPSEWYVDRFATAWRSNGGADSEWPFAMTNYGGLKILGGDGLVHEWDTESSQWSGEPINFSDWIEEVIVQGKAYMEE